MLTRSKLTTGTSNDRDGVLHRESAQERDDSERWGKGNKIHHMLVPLQRKEDERRPKDKRGGWYCTS